MSTIGIHRLVGGVLTSADAAYLEVTDQAGDVVVASVLVAPTSAGVYAYTAPPLDPGNYTAQWTFQVSAYADDVVSRIFQIESPAAALDGITLAQIEQAIAARIGPYEKMTVGAGSSTVALPVRKLMSSLVLGDYEDRYILRRGVMRTGELVEDFVETDRSRIVLEYAATTGRLTPDLEWTTAPIEGEEIELHYLDPDALREIALEGLRRCYFWDTVDISATATLTDLNLTSTAPWITDTSQIRQVQQGRYPYYMENVSWFDSYQQGDQVYLRMGPIALGSVRIKALRPHFSYVNGETSVVGPNHDHDVLNINRQYAAAAGHIAAWMLQPTRMVPVAAQGLAINREQAANEFTKASMTYVKTESERIQNRFAMGDRADLGQIGNI